MLSSEQWIACLESADASAVRAALDDDGSRANSFLTQPRPWGQEHWMPLHFAAAAGNLSAVDTLLDRGVHPDCRTRFTTPMQARRTALHLAAADGHSAVAERLLLAGAEVEVYDAARRSPLWLAARHGHADLVKLLLDHGADPDARDQQGRPPLHAALLPPEVMSPATTLLSAAKHLVPLCGALLAAGADPNAPCPKEPAGYTPLHRVVTLAHHFATRADAEPPAKRPVPDPQPLIQLLLDHDADPAAADPRHGRTPRDLAEHLGLRFDHL